MVAEDGTVTEVVTRQQMRARNLRHRCTYVAVLAGDRPAQTEPERGARVDPSTGLWVHQRAAWKDVHPSYWDLGFGGVCGVGEAWRPSAKRELAEEAGVTGVPLTEIGSVRYEDRSTSVVGRCFLAWWPEEPTCPDGEVVALATVALEDLERWVTTRDVCPDSVAALVAPLNALIGREPPVAHI